MDTKQNMNSPGDGKQKQTDDKPLPGWFAGAGWSMFPTLLPGDVVRIGFAENGYQVGHIVAFYLENRLMIHRIVSQDPAKGAWRVKGDACVHFDPWLSNADIVGHISMARRGSQIIAIATDQAKAGISLKLGSLASKYLRLLPRRWARVLYLICFLLANATLRSTRFVRRLYKPM